MSFYWPYSSMTIDAQLALPCSLFIDFVIDNNVVVAGRSLPAAYSFVGRLFEILFVDGARRKLLW